MNVLEVVDEFPTSMVKYYIDVPIDIEMHEPECRRIQIPRELGVYIRSLQREIRELKEQLKQ